MQSLCYWTATALCPPYSRVKEVVPGCANKHGANFARRRCFRLFYRLGRYRPPKVQGLEAYTFDPSCMKYTKLPIRKRYFRTGFRVSLPPRVGLK